jgi:kelch-like protein 10
MRSEEAAFDAIMQWIDHNPSERANHIITLLGKLRLGLMDTEFFMHHVRANKYIKEIGEPARPLIREALQILHRLELTDSNYPGMGTFS